MRVGLVIYGSLSNTTGGFLYDRKLVESLREAGANVEVIELPWRSYPRHLLDALNQEVRSRLEAAPVDVLVQDELCHSSLVWHNRRLEREVPIISIVHHLRSSESHPVPHAWVYRWVERRYLGTVDGLVCSSQANCAAARRLGASTASVVAHPGRGRFDPDVTADEIERRAREPGALRIVFLGSVVPRKGVHTLVEGLARLPEAAGRLTVIGDRTVAPGYVDDLQGRIDRLGIREDVAFTGRLSDAEVEAELREGHVLAMPSTYEGFGIAYLEGMGFGLVPIATAAGGPPEFITDDQNGLLVAPESPAAIARRLRRLIDDRDRLARLGRAARERYAAHPSWTAAMEPVHSFLTHMTNE